jgi:hypothetical protein
MNIFWFQFGIKDLSLDAVKASINANKSNSEAFDSMKDTYVDFMQTEPPTKNPRAQQLVPEWTWAETKDKDWQCSPKGFDPLI